MIVDLFLRHNLLNDSVKILEKHQVSVVREGKGL